MIEQKKRSRAKNIFIWVTRVLIFQLVLINISAAFHAHRFTHYYDDDGVRNLRSSSGKVLLRTWRLMVGRKLPKSTVNYFPPFPYSRVLLETKSGLEIEGWISRKESAMGTVILVHGLGSNKGEHLTEAIAFYELGYNVMLIDLRAHGNSDGTSHSIGVREAEEVKLAFDHVKNSGEKNIIMWGMSLGAVVISRAVYEHDIQPSHVVLEMPFDRLQDHLKARARVLGFPSEPFGFFVTFWAGAEQGYWGYGHRTSKYVKRMKMPVLLQWGAKDEYVMKKEVDRIFNNISADKKEFVVYDNAGHERLLARDPSKWQEVVTKFISE